MAWKVVQKSNQAHVIPVDDVMPHQEDPFCICGPYLDEKCPTLWIHQSMADEEAAITAGPFVLTRKELIV